MIAPLSPPVSPTLPSLFEEIDYMERGEESPWTKDFNEISSVSAIEPPAEKTIPKKREPLFIRIKKKSLPGQATPLLQNDSIVASTPPKSNKEQEPIEKSSEEEIENDESDSSAGTDTSNNPVLFQTIGTNITLLKKLHRLSDEKIAKVIPYSKQTVADHRLGKKCDADFLVHLAEYFDITKEQLCSVTYTETLRKALDALPCHERDTKLLRVIIGKNIQLLQKKQGYSNLEAAEKANLPKKTYKNYKFALSYNAKIVAAIAEAFEISVSEISSPESTKKLEQEIKNREAQSPSNEQLRQIVSENIKMLQYQQKLSATKIATLVPCSRRTYYSHQSGEVFDEKTATKIAQIFNVTFKELTTPNLGKDKEPGLPQLSEKQKQLRTLGKNIAYLQQKLELTDREIAEKIGLPKTTYQSHKLGKNSWPEVIKKIANFFAISEEKLSSTILCLETISNNPE